MATGLGAGTRALASRPNVLRVLVTEAIPGGADRVTRIAFEIDDMTPEEIAVALDRLRGDPGVLDAGFTLGFGKKGRPRFAIEVLARPEAAEAVAQACFIETSTLGLRLETVERRVLDRRLTDGLPRIKVAERPGGATAKAESDDLAAIPGLAARRAAARKAEALDG
jgi:pyridinium-3,5-bisthiocarboxylic acid mononucleotide nickel chelatase